MVGSIQSELLYVGSSLDVRMLFDSFKDFVLTSNMKIDFYGGGLIAA